MVVSYYLRKYPYRLVWHTLAWMEKNPPAVVYCSEPLDYTILAPILKHLPAMPLIAKNRTTARYLRQRGVLCHLLPSYPKAVIMCRHAAHRFPEQRIVKIGFRHGADHFKDFAKARYYQAFDAYGVTSEKEVELLRQRGVGIAHAVGFPKLDPAFDGSLAPHQLQEFRHKTGIVPVKKTILFSATWDRSGMSAVDQWIDRLPELADVFNILVTLHPWTSAKYAKKIKRMKQVKFIDSTETLPYLMIADVMVGDHSSIIAEFCALNKPMVLFQVQPNKREVPEMKSLLAEIGVTIEHGSQLLSALNRCLDNPYGQRHARQKASALMFGELDGRAGSRAAALIAECLRGRGIPLDDSPVNSGKSL